MRTDPLYPDVVFYGAPGAGKTTARELLERLGYATVSFAGFHRGGLRDVVGRTFGVLAVNDRRILNAVGMDMREVDPNVWVRNAMFEVDKIHDVERAPVVIDDMRGDNEWNALRARGFVTIHVVADDVVRGDRLARNGKLEGSSREELPFLYELEDAARYHPDYIVTNNGTQDELYAAVTDILNQERSKRA